MIGLPYGEKNYDHSWAVFIWYRNVTDDGRTDRQTDGQTDGRTDRFAISISRVSMLTRDKNSRVRQIHMLKPTVQQYQQCCQLANGNKTCCSLLLFKNNNGARGSQGFVRQSSRNVALRVEQPSMLNKFFSELQYAAAFGRESRKFTGWVWKYAKFRHFLAHPVV